MLSPGAKGKLIPAPVNRRRRAVACVTTPTLTSGGRGSIYTGFRVIVATLDDVVARASACSDAFRLAFLNVVFLIRKRII